MPLYEYRCKACAYSFEKIQSFAAEPERVCPKCGGELVRPLSAPALQFKGAGWYINDYASKGKASASAEGAASEAGSSEKSPGDKPSNEKSPGAHSSTEAAESKPAAPTAAKSAESAPAAAAASATAPPTSSSSAAD